MRFGFAGPVFDAAKAVEDDVEGPFGDDPGVKLFE